MKYVIVIIYLMRPLNHGFHSYLAHIINFATETFLSTYSKAPHYNPHDLKGHKPNISQHIDNWDEIRLICAICVKVH
jgi:hypothetical protein